MKAIKLLILGLAASLLLVTQVTAHNVGSSPPREARITVNTCNGAVVGYNAPWVYGITAVHCVGNPMPKVYIGEDVVVGEIQLKLGDLAFIRWQGDKPSIVLDFAQVLPESGDSVWVAGSVNSNYLPIPAVWLGHKMVFKDYTVVMIYGTVAKGFSGSPVLNLEGQLIGIISTGTFIDSKNKESIIAPWAGVSILPHLRN